MEPFGIATSILQVAEIGFSLAKNLYSCAQDVKNAKSEVRKVASEINITSKVLQNFGDILNDENAKALCSPQLQIDAQQTLDECRAAFGELNKTLGPFRKPENGGVISNKARLKWSTSKSKTKAYQARLERLKSSLSLMLEILRFAKDTKSQSPASTPTLHVDRHHIEDLIRTNEAPVRSIMSSDAICPAPSTTEENTPTATRCSGISPGVSFPREQAMTEVSKHSSMAATEEDSVPKQLKACIDAAEKVAESLNAALAEWLGSQTLPQKPYQQSLEQLHRHIFNLDTLLGDTPASEAEALPTPIVQSLQLNIGSQNTEYFCNFETSNASSESRASSRNVTPKGVGANFAPSASPPFAGHIAKQSQPQASRADTKALPEDYPYEIPHPASSHVAYASAYMSGEPSTEIPIRRLYDEPSSGSRQSRLETVSTISYSPTAAVYQARAKRAGNPVKVEARLNNEGEVAGNRAMQQLQGGAQSTASQLGHAQQHAVPAQPCQVTKRVDWSSYQPPRSPSSGLSQGKYSGYIEQDNPLVDSFYGLGVPDLDAAKSRPKKKRQQSSDRPVAKASRRSPSDRNLRNNEVKLDEKDHESVEGFEVAKSLEMLWTRWTNLSPEVLERTATLN